MICAALVALILTFGPVSGAHFNPVVSLADWFLGRRSGAGLSLAEVGAYAAAQVAGGIAGAVLANVMFEVGTELSGKDRMSSGPLVGEIVATAAGDGLTADVDGLGDRPAGVCPRSHPLVGAAGTVLKSDGTDPAWGTVLQAVRVQTFTGSGTYTPHAKMLYCQIEAVGGGGGGGGIDADGNAMAAGGGGAATALTDCSYRRSRVANVGFIPFRMSIRFVLQNQPL